VVSLHFGTVPDWPLGRPTTTSSVEIGVIATWANARLRPSGYTWEMFAKKVKNTSTPSSSTLLVRRCNIGEIKHKRLRYPNEIRTVDA